MSDKKRVLIMILVVLAVVPFVFAQDFNLIIGQEPGRLCPGSTGLFTHVVENLDSSVTDYTVSTSGRASVFSTYVPQGFSLDPGERRTIFTYMTPRSTTSIGTYDLNLVVSSDGNSESVSHSLVVEDCFDYTLEALETLKHACPCDSEKFEFLLVNAGNYDETYDLTVQGVKAGSISLSDNVITVPAGGEKRIYAYIVASCDDKAGNYDFTITVDPRIGGSVKSVTSTLVIDPCYDFSIRTQKDLVTMCEHTIETNSIEITNDGSTANRYNLELDGPVWTKLERNTLDIPAGSTGTVSLAFSPDYGVEGNFMITFKAVTEKGQIAAVNEFDVNVRDCYSVFVNIERDFEKICNSLDNSYGVEIENIGEFGKDFIIEVFGPEWVELDDYSLNLGPGERSFVNLVISPTQDVVPSTYQIKVKVTAKDSDKITAEDSMDITTVTREECYQASIVPNKKDVLVYYDATATVPIVIENKGTYTATYDLGVSGTSSNFVYLNPAVVEVEAGKAELVYLYVAPSGQVGDGSYTATVSARLGDSVILATDTISIEVTESKIVAEEPIDITGAAPVEVEEGTSLFGRIRGFFRRLFAPGAEEEEPVEVPESVEEITEEVGEEVSEEELTEEEVEEGPEVVIESEPGVAAVEPGVVVEEEPIVVELEEIDLETAEADVHLASLDEEATLMINGEEHNVKVNELTEDSITIEINSDPIFATLNVGESKEIDLDGDGVNDLKVTFNGLVDGEADLTYEKIIEVEEEPVEEEVPEEEPVEEPLELPETVPETRTIEISAENYAYSITEMQANIGDTVEVVFTSVDQDYSLAIEEFGIDKTVLAGRTSTFEFEADKEGTFDFYCSVPCGEEGVERRDMAGTLVIGAAEATEIVEDEPVEVTGEVVAETEERDVPTFFEWLVMNKFWVIIVIVIIILIIIGIKSNFHKKLVDFFEEEIEEEELEGMETKEEKPVEKKKEEPKEEKKLEKKPEKKEVKKEEKKLEKKEEKKEEKPKKKDDKEKKYL